MLLTSSPRIHLALSSHEGHRRRIIAARRPAVSMLSHRQNVSMRIVTIGSQQKCQVASQNLDLIAEAFAMPASEML